MNKTVLIYSCVLLIGVLVSAISQVLLKKAAMKHYENHLKEYLNPMVIFAYAMFVGTTFLSIIAYRGIPLFNGTDIRGNKLYLCYDIWSEDFS